MRLNRIWGSGAVLCGSLLMSWPAIYNRYPLLYPDSMSYLDNGRLVGRALFLHKFSPFYGERSLIYCLGILPLHWNITPWPIVAANALLTAYVIWLLVRSVLQRQTVAGYLAVVAPLSLLTGMGWFVSLIMPDILGPVLYLSIYLLVFARETLSRKERVILVLVAWWGMVSHITHLVLAVGLCTVLVPILILQGQQTLRWLAAVGRVMMIVLVAAASQIALNAYLYDEPSLNGERPPFLTARIIADGPGFRYLQGHCGKIDLAICGYVRELPSTTDHFLWAPNGIWQNASDETQRRLRNEEMRFVLATLRTYPIEELSIAATNWWRQLMTFSLEHDYDPNAWMLGEFDHVLPGALPRYMRSRQARGVLPDSLSTLVQNWAVMVSLLVIGVLTVSLRHRQSPRVIGLVAVIVAAVIGNAWVTGVLSDVENRYQSRVVWLLMLLAGVMVLEWHDRRLAAHLEQCVCRVDVQKEHGTGNR